MKKDKFRSIDTQEISFPTAKGSIRVHSDPAGKLTVGALTAPGVAEALVVDPVENNVFVSELKFPDGSSFTSAIDLDDLKVPVFLLKANKIFFKYDKDGNAVPEQTITLTLDTANIDDPTPDSISFVPAIPNAPILDIISYKQRTLTVEQFELFESNEVEIIISIGGITDSVTIYKVRDGVSYLQGGLTNPAGVLQTSYDSNRNLYIPAYEQRLQAEGGKFIVFKDGQDITNDPRITFSVSTDDIVTDGLEVQIDSDTGQYSITEFDVSRTEFGVATFVAHDSVSNQIFEARYAISIVKEGIQGPEGPQGSVGSDAKSVSLTFTDGQIAYDSEGTNPVTNKQDNNGNYIIEVLAEASSNHSNSVIYEFWVTEAGGENNFIIQRGSSPTLILSNNSRSYSNGSTAVNYQFIDSTKDGYGGGKVITLRTYEGSAATVPTAQDQTKIIATKDGSDAISVNLENSAHTFAAFPNEQGKYIVNDYTKGGSIIEVYYGNEELVGNLTATQTSQLSNGQFRVEVIDEDNINASSIYSQQSRFGFTYFYTGDPSNFDEDADTATVTYLIVGKSSKGVEKSATVQISYTKSKKGDKGKDGLDQTIYNFSKIETVNGVARAAGWQDSNLTGYQAFSGDVAYSSKGTVEKSNDSNYGGSILEIENLNSSFSIFSELIPVDGNLTYVTKRRYRSYTQDVYTSVAFYDHNKTYIGKHDLAKALTSYGWREDKVFIKDIGTQSESNLSDGQSTHFLYTSNRSAKYVRLVIIVDNITSDETAQFDYFIIEPAKADLDKNGSLPGGQLTKERSGFYFTDTGKLHIGLDRVQKEPETGEYTADERDISIVTGDQDSTPDINLFKAWVPNVNDASVFYPIGKLSFSGYDGQYWTFGLNSYRSLSYHEKANITTKINSYGGASTRIEAVPQKYYAGGRSFSWGGNSTAANLNTVVFFSGGEQRLSISPFGVPGDWYEYAPPSVCIGDLPHPYNTANKQFSFIVYGESRMSSIIPYANGSYDLGTSSIKWKNIYTDSLTQTSDINAKKDINSISLGLNFIEKLRPVEYRLKDVEVATTKIDPENNEKFITENKTITHKRKHYGLIAQEIKQLLDEQNIDTNDFAPYCYDKESDSSSLRYTEFIPILIKGIQELSAKNDELVKEINHIKSILSGSL